MVMLASPGVSWPPISSWSQILSSPWPRMGPCKGNPFQNTSGLFIPALPNLAGTTASTKEGTPATDLPLPPSPPPQRPPSSSLSPSYENHFDLGDVTGFPPPIEGEIGSEQQQQQQQPPEESQSSSEPSTPTQSINTPSASPAKSDFREGSKEEGVEGEGEGEEVKVRKGERRKRKRGGRSRKGRGRPQPCELPIAPRFMGLSGIHYGLWAQYVCPQAPAPPPPPPPSAMINHHPSHAWPFSGYHHHQVGFVAAPNSPVAPLFLNPAVPA